MRQYRQGDVLIEETKKMPEGINQVNEDKPVILAYGEVTGHCHQIKSGAKEYQFSGDKFGNRLITLDKEAQLVHEEHSTITMPVGNYRIIQQMEYQQEIRPVRD